MLACIAIAAAVSLLRLQGEPTEQSEGVLALLAGGQYEEAEAAARSNLSALRQSYGETSLKIANGSDLLVRALRLNGKASVGETLVLAERTLKIKRMHFGAVHQETAVSLLNLGQVLADRGNLDRAIAELRHALNIQEQLAGAHELDIAEALDALGMVLTRARSYDAALRVVERSVQIKERALPLNHSLLSGTLEIAAAALQGKGDYVGARQRLDRALTTRRQSGGSHPSQVTTLNLLALQLWFEGDLLQSRDVSLRALSVAHQTLRPDHPDIARALRVLAATIDDLGDVTGSRTCREQALAIAQRSLGETHYELAAYLNDLGNLNLLLGAYADARDQFERSLRVAEATLPPQHEWIPTIVHNLALVDARLGDFSGARRQHARAIELWERALGADHPFIAVALTELASVLREQDAAANALPLLERAHSIRDRALVFEHRDSARTLADIAATLSQMGQNDRAQQFAARALSIFERTDAVDAPDLATVLELYAHLQLSRGAFQDARRYFERALAIRRKAFGPSHPEVADVQAGLATTQARLGNAPQAFASALAAETIGRDHLRLISRYLPERQALNYAAKRPRALDLMLSLTRTAESDSAALDALIRGRALVLDEMAARRRLPTASADALAGLRTQLTSAEQRFANLLVRGPKEHTADQYRTIVDEARRSKENAERVMAARSASFREQRNQAQAGLQEVRANLPRDAAMVSFVRFGRVSLQRTRAGAPLPASREEPGAPSYVAVILRHGRDPEFVSLGTARVIDSLIGRWRSDIGAAAKGGAALGSSAHSLRIAGIGLRAAVWDPLAPHLRGARMVFVVPDGALNLVPIVALPGHRSEFLLDEIPVVHYLSAERDLVTASRRSTAQGLLALGGADFDSQAQGSPGSTPSHHAASPAAAPSRATTSTCVGFGGMQFGALSDTLQEVRDIAGLWTSQSSTAVDGVRVLAGSDADERTFKREAHRYQVLHLATHGFFLGGSCQARDAGLRSVGGLVSGTPPSNGVGTGPERENPLVLSGLALAGANRRASTETDEDDGILTAEEVASLDLQGTEWAVLSACDTGLGEFKAGEGVLGLRRAFQIAGARTVIMSLWSVEDQATRVWMRALYDGRLNKRLNTADAVREASLSVLRARRSSGLSTHPFYWAAFVAAGDWH
jgi:CHAT domain-containing protein/tetratricopeptide (TPR) repeat protein